MRHYSQANPTALERLLSVKSAVTQIPKELKALMELHVSYTNGCSYCIDLHRREAVAFGVDPAKLDEAAPEEIFSDKERVALTWARALTRVSEGLDRAHLHKELQTQFSDDEIADLTYVIATMNALNRMAVGYGDKPSPVK